MLSARLFKFFAFHICLFFNFSGQNFVSEKIFFQEKQKYSKNYKIISIFLAASRTWKKQRNWSTSCFESNQYFKSVCIILRQVKSNVTIIYIIGGSPRLVSSPESIRRVGRFRFVIETVTIYLRRGKKGFPGMNKSSCHPTGINGRKYILTIIF